jgi:hypothetical protein
MAEEDRRFTAQDLLVIIAGAGLGAPFCAAAAKAALDGNAVQALIGFVVGLPLIVLAAVFPFAKRSFSSIVRSWIAAGSGVVLLFLILAAFIYVLGPSIYTHVAQPTPERPFLTAGPIDSDFEGRPLGFLWNSAYLEIQAQPQSDGSSAITISTYMVSGKNLGPEEITLTDAYIVSAIDSAKLDFKINATPGGMIDIKDASPIPASAGFQLQANFRLNNQAVPENEFLKQWSSFYVVIEANGEKIRHFIDRTIIHRQLDVNHPELFPHVTKRR